MGGLSPFNIFSNRILSRRNPVPLGILRAPESSIQRFTGTSAARPRGEAKKRAESGGKSPIPFPTTRQHSPRKTWRCGSGCRHRRRMRSCHHVQSAWNRCVRTAVPSHSPDPPFTRVIAIANGSCRRGDRPLGVGSARCSTRAAGTTSMPHARGAGSARTMREGCGIRAVRCAGPSRLPGAGPRRHCAG